MCSFTIQPGRQQSLYCWTTFQNFPAVALLYRTVLHVRNLSSPAHSWIPPHQCAQIDVMPAINIRSWPSMLCTHCGPARRKILFEFICGHCWCSLDCADVFQDTNTHCAEGCHPIAGTLLSITEFSHLLGSHLRLHSIAFHPSIHLAQQAIHQLCSSNSAGFWFVSY